MCWNATNPKTFCSTTSSPTGPRRSLSRAKGHGARTGPLRRPGEEVCTYARVSCLRSPLPHPPEPAEDPKIFASCRRAAVSGARREGAGAAATPAINSRILVPSRRDEGTCVQQWARRAPVARCARTSPRERMGAEASSRRAHLMNLRERVSKENGRRASA